MSATRNYTSKVPEWMERIENERLQALREILREAGESGDSRYDANTVYNMSKGALHEAANEFIDADRVREQLAEVPGVDEEQVANETADMPPIEVWEYAQDTRIKIEIAARTSSEPEPTPVSVEDALRWYEAEEYAAEREFIEEQFPDQDFSDMHDDEIRDFVVGETTKAILDKDGSPLDPETLVDHARADLIGDLTNEHGYDRDEINDSSLGELMEMHAEATGFGGSDGGTTDPMNPDQTPSGSPPSTSPDPMADRMKDRLEDGPRGTGNNGGSQGSGSTDSGGSSSNPGGSLSGSGAGIVDGAPSGTIPGGSSGGSSTGGSSRGDSQGGGGDSGGDSSGPPAGSTHYGHSMTGPSGNVIGGETGYRDADGNWYEADGSPMGAEKADRMEGRYQDGELTEGSTVPDGSDSDDSSDSSDTTTDDDSADDPPPDDGEDVEYTPDGETLPSGPSTGSTDQLRASAEQYREIVDAARAGSTINPVPDGYTEAAPAGDPEPDNSLVGPDGDSRYDGVATTGSGAAPTGPNYGSSQGAGTIDYGPEANIDYGTGPQDEVPTDIGPEEDLSHLAGNVTGEQDEEEPLAGPFPSGVSPADLKVADNTPAGLENVTLVPQQPAEPVFYMAVEDRPEYSSAAEDDEAEPTIDYRAEPVPVGAVSSLDIFDLEIDDADDSKESSSAEEVAPVAVTVEPVIAVVEETGATAEAPEESGDPLDPIDFETGSPTDEPRGKTQEEAESEITFISEPELERTAKQEPAVEEEATSDTSYPIAELATPVASVVAHTELIDARLDLTTESDSTDDDDDDAAGG